MAKDAYKNDVIDPGDRASRLANGINFASFGNCPAVRIVPHQPANFRGPVGYVWQKEILHDLMSYEIDRNTGKITDWTMLEQVENDGAGGKPQFFTLVGTPKVFQGLGWEIITMTADDFARSGRLPAIMINEIQAKRITSQNFHLVEAMLTGYGQALKKSNLVNLTGEVAVMKHSITAFCDQNSDSQLVLTWGGTCVGLAHKDLLIDGSKIRPGMPIVGFWEPGYRCNGGTFFTNLLLASYKSVESILKSPDAIEFIVKLTVPSRSYAKTITRVIGWQPDGSIGEPVAEIAGIAHITGGGVWGKFGEILPQGVGAELTNMPLPARVLLEAQEMSWDIPELRLTDRQVYRTLHGGCGMLIICDNMDSVDLLRREAQKDGIVVYIVGSTTESVNKKVVIKSRFKEGKVLSSLDQD